jgi:hypothetical protein
VVGVDQAVVRAHAAAELAATKAAELDSHYKISGTVDSFLNQEVEVDEGYLEEAVQDFFTTSMEKIASVGAFAEKVFQGVITPAQPEHIKHKGSAARDIFISKAADATAAVALTSPTPSRGGTRRATSKKKKTLDSEPSLDEGAEGLVTASETVASVPAASITETGERLAKVPEALHEPTPSACDHQSIVAAAEPDVEKPMLKSAGPSVSGEAKSDMVHADEADAPSVGTAAADGLDGL